MIRWLKRKKQSDPKSVPSSGDRPGISLGSTPNTNPEAVKMSGAIKAAQEAQQRGARGFLYVYDGPDAGTVFFLEKVPVSIGRRPSKCMFAFKDRLV
jgi:hypothetical protein